MQPALDHCAALLPTKSRVVCMGYEVCLSLQNPGLYAQRDTMFVSPYKIQGCMHTGILCLSLPTKSRVVCTTGYYVCLSLQNPGLYAQRDTKFFFPYKILGLYAWDTKFVSPYKIWGCIHNGILCLSLPTKSKVVCTMGC